MQDRYAYATVLVNVGMPHLGRESHTGRSVWVVIGECHDGVEEASLILRSGTDTRVRRSRRL